MTPTPAPSEPVPPSHVVSPETMIPDLVRAAPAAREVLDRYGLTGCGGPLGPAETLRFFARAHGVDEHRLLAELREAVASGSGGPPNSAPPSTADTIYRRYFTAAILLVLTAGASWGALLLWRIGLAGSFTSLSIHEVNAHGEAQIFGWVGLFVMGFAYQAFPRMWHTRLVAPRLAVGALVAMVAGVALRTVGMVLGGPAGLGAAMAGGGLEALAVFAFVAQILTTFRRGDVEREPYVAFVVAALAWFAIQAVVSPWHTWSTMTAGSGEELLRRLATYQPPLRDLQIHGFALFMVLGVSMRMFPALFGLSPVPSRRGWWAFGALVAAVLGETSLFLAYRATGNPALAALLLGPWTLLGVGVSLVAVPWRLWRPLPQTDRSGKFVRMAYAWLGVSVLMLLLLPVHRAVSGLSFSHAYHGAIRHAVTVGFVSLMIMGMGAKVVATLNGRDSGSLPSLAGPFLLANTGCFLRVTTQVLTDVHPFFFRVVGVSGLLEVTALAWWGFGLLGVMRAGRLASAGPSSAAASLPPARIEADHVVASVVEWYPATLDVFRRHGFRALSNPMLRRTVARTVTVRQAAAFQGADLEALLADLNLAVGGRIAYGRADSSSNGSVSGPAAPLHKRSRHDS